MMTALWLGAVTVGFGVTLVGSRRAVTYASVLASGSRLPPFFVGMTLLALGTDLPEIANSIVASFTDNGDVNVGDSIGSSVAQHTLVLGLMPFLALAIPLGERGSRLLRGQQITVWLTAGALGLIAILALDDHLGRLDAAVLITTWVVGSRLAYHFTRSDPQLDLVEEPSNRLGLVVRLLAAAVVITSGAALAVLSITELAELWGVPAFIVAFFGASLGTSLPELVVVVTALRRGQTGLAIGDILGASFVDATLSISMGPLLFPTVIDGGLAVTGALVAVGAAVLVALLLGRGGEINRQGGAILLLAYVATWPILL